MAGRYRGNGEGTISKRKDGRWVARYHVRTADPEKPMRRRAIYARSRSEAAAKLAKAIADRDGRGVLSAEPTKLTVAGYMGDWLAGKKAELAPDSYRNHEQVVRDWISPALGSIKLTDLRRAHVEALKAQMAEGGLAPATASRVLSVLSAALNQAVAWEAILSNPAASVKRPRERAQRMRALSEEEASRLLAVARGTRHEVLYEVAVKLGPRQGELRGLRWSDLDLDGAPPTLTVERSVSTTSAVVWGSTKTGENRTIRLSPGLVASLRRHRKAQLEERAAAGFWEDPSLVFPNGRGGIWRHQHLHVVFKRDLEEAGLPREVRMHDLRHTAATLMLKKGVPVHVVARILGHSDPAMTLRRYAHALPDMQELAANALDSYAF